MFWHCWSRTWIGEHEPGQDRLKQVAPLRVGLKTLQAKAHDARGMYAVGRLAGAYLRGGLIHEINGQPVSPVIASPASENDLRADWSTVLDRVRKLVWFRVELCGELGESGVVRAHEHESRFAAPKVAGNHWKELAAQLGGHCLRAVAHADVCLLHLADQTPFFPCEGMSERCGGGGIPAALKSLMNAVLNKKWGTSGTYPPETWPETVNLMGPLEEKTVSGSVVAFSDGADDVPLKSCAVTIAPNLDGVSSVDVVRAGKNVFDITTYPITKKRYIRASDGYFAISTINLRGATEDYIPCVSMRGKTWVINKPNQSGNTMGVAFYDESKAFLSSVLTWPGGTNGVFTVPNNAYYFRFTVDLSSADDTEIQIEAGTTVTAYTPFVQPTTHTANLGRTIYGGSVDVVQGTGTDEYTFDLWDGTQNYNVSDNLTNVFRIYMAHAKPLPDPTAVQCICEGYTFPRAGWSSDTVSFYSDANNFTLKLPKTEVTTLAEAKAWLAQHNVTFLYATTPEDFTFTPVPIISRTYDD